MSKLVLIDGNAILHRAYHALPPLTTKDKEPINAVYGFISMLLRTIQDLGPTHIMVAFDRKEPTFRHEEFEEYQAHRPEMDKDLAGQFDKAKDVIGAFGIPTYEKIGFEADDVMGTIAERLQKKVDEVVIVTGDKDILQLVNGKVKVFLLLRGVTRGKVYGKKSVVEKLGVRPCQVPDFKALAGDPSDNYPGVRGIGPKTAEKLLKKYESIDDVYKNLNKIDEKIAKKLKEEKDNVYLYLKLARIVKDVGVDVDFKKSSSWSVDNKKVINLFKKFGFKTLTKRVKDVGKELAKSNQMALI